MQGQELEKEGEGDALLSSSQLVQTPQRNQHLQSVSVLQHRNELFTSLHFRLDIT
jgi:hypothetical protein